MGSSQRPGQLLCAWSIFAIRDVVGQLLEYRHFLGPQRAELCILLDQDPGEVLERYVERELELLLLWQAPDGLEAGKGTSQKLAAMSFPTR